MVRFIVGGVARIKIGFAQSGEWQRGTLRNGASFIPLPAARVGPHLQGKVVQTGAGDEGMATELGQKRMQDI